MGNELQELTLADVSSDVSYGYTESASVEKVGPRFLRITDIQNGTVDWNTVPYCPISESNLKKYRLERGDIVVARTGNSTGENYIFESDEEAVFASYLIRFKIAPEKAFPLFVWYSIRSSHWWTFINGSKTGSAQAGANAKVLGRFPLRLPSLPVQRAISHILGSLDDKIELNRQMNRTLEKIAQAIFKSWFIDFDPVRRNAARAQNQPSPPAPLPEVEGRKNNYRGGFDFSGLVSIARELREKQTPAEEIFWAVVRNRQFMGLKFRRQHQIGEYVADFYCHEQKIVIELDGGVHKTKQKKDDKRDAYMDSLGLTVLRFPNKQIIKEIETVLTQIAEAFPPLPLGEGMGEGVVGSEAFDHLFPDSFEDSELGEIPKGWEVKPIGDVIELAYGKSLPKNKRVHGQFPVYGSGGITGFHNEHIVEGPGIIVGRKGTVGSVYWEERGFFPIDTVFYVNTKIWLPLYWVFLRLSLMDIQKLGADSAVPGVNRNSVYAQKWIVPADEVVKKFQVLSDGFLRQAEENRQQIHNLSKTRGTLLPKLISGELPIPDAEKILEGVE